MSDPDFDARRPPVTAQAIRAHQLPPPPGWRKRSYDADAVDRYLVRISEEVQRLGSELALARRDAAVKTQALQEWQTERFQQPTFAPPQPPVADPQPEEVRAAVTAEAVEILSRAQQAADRMVGEAQQYARETAERMVADAENYTRELAQRSNGEYRQALAAVRAEAQLQAEEAVREYRASAEAYEAEVEDVRRLLAWMRGLSNALAGMEAHLNTTRRQFDTSIDRLALPEPPRLVDLRIPAPPPPPAASTSPQDDAPAEQPPVVL